MFATILRESFKMAALRALSWAGCKTQAHCLSCVLMNILITVCGRAANLQRPNSPSWNGTGCARLLIFLAGSVCRSLKVCRQVTSGLLSKPFWRSDGPNKGHCLICTTSSLLGEKAKQYSFLCCPAPSLGIVVFCCQECHCTVSVVSWRSLQDAVPAPKTYMIAHQKQVRREFTWGRTTNSSWLPGHLAGCCLWAKKPSSLWWPPWLAPECGWHAKPQGGLSERPFCWYSGKL